MANKDCETNSLTRVELETTIHEIEACINSRPLTFLGDDINSEDPITHAHFLLARSEGYFSGSPLNVMPDSSQQLAVRLQFRKLLLDKFWSIWSTEYLCNRPPCVGPQGKGHPIVGSVVLVEDETSNRLRWPLGIVTRLFPGIDGVIRTLEVKVGSSVLIKPVQRIHDLELVHCSSSDVSVPSSTPEMTETGSDPVVNTTTADGLTTDTPAGSVKSKPSGVSVVKRPSGDSGGPISVNQSENHNCDKPIITRKGRIVKPVIKLDL